MSLPTIVGWNDLTGMFAQSPTGKTLISEGNWSEFVKGWNAVAETNGMELRGGTFIKTKPGVGTRYKPVEISSLGAPDSVIAENYGIRSTGANWYTGSATSGSTTGSLTGGSKVAIQELDATIDSTTSKIEVKTRPTTALSNITAEQMLGGAFLGVGLGVKLTEIDPNFVAEFSNFCLQPLIELGFLEPATAEDLEVGFVDTIVERNPLLQPIGDGGIWEYGSEEGIQRALEFALSKGVFSDSSYGGKTASGLVLMDYANIDNGFLELFLDKSIDAYSIANIKVTSLAPLISVHKAEIFAFTANLLNNANFNFKNDKYYYLNVDMSTLNNGSTRFNVTVQECDTLNIYCNYTPLENDDYNEGINTNRIKFTYPKTVLGTIHLVKFTCVPHGDTLESSTVTFENEEITSREIKYTQDSDSTVWNGLHVNAITSSVSTIVRIIANTTNILTDYKGGIKGIYKTDKTLNIQNLADIANVLKTWRTKGYSIGVPLRDNSGFFNRLRASWMLPLKRVSKKSQSEVITPAEIPEESEIPDDDTDTQDDVVGGVQDNTDDEGEEDGTGGTTPKPTPPSDDTGVITPPPSSLGKNGAGLWSVYNPTLDELNAFGKWLWSNNVWTQIQQYFSNPLEGIIGLHKIYCTPTVGNKANIIAGYLDSKISSDTVIKQYERIDCGSIGCAEFYGNSLDYAPFTTVSLYLPFIGIVDLNVNDVMGNILHVFYDVDILTGACLASVEVISNGTVSNLYQYNGLCSVQIPLTSGNYGSVIASLFTTGIGVVGTIASGGALAPILATGAVSAVQSGTTIRQSGTIGSNVGAMAIKKPYMIIARKIPHMPNNWNELGGYPSNNRVVLKNCKGYVKAKDIFFADATATATEKAMIVDYLKNGIIIN